MFEKLKTWWQLTNPYGRLELTAKYPQERDLIFHRKIGGYFHLSAYPADLFELLAVEINPKIADLDERVSRGAIIGAGAAKLNDRDVLKGAVMGDWLSKRDHPQRTKPYRLTLRLKNRRTEEELSFDFSLYEKDCRTVYRYFR
ncbi:MAG: hypothetical protein Q4A21_03615 [bacterium]|nr:hypothetical protein [bacterium]